MNLALLFNHISYLSGFVRCMLHLSLCSNHGAPILPVWARTLLLTAIHEDVYVYVTHHP